VKVIEFAGLGPAPFAATMLADLGASVLRIDRQAPSLFPGFTTDPLVRRRATLQLDLKVPAERERCFTAIERADALIEGFRPGVMERLGVGPDACFARNARLVYGRATGWGQDGPLARTAGHDINYLALAGALGLVGPRNGPPIPPLNLVGDFGGGGMLLAFGVACALLETRASGRGQVIDASMVDGAAHLASYVMGLRASGLWPGRRGENLLDGGAHFYRCYECADGRWIAVGAIEPQFYAELLRRLEISDPEFGAQFDRTRWPLLAARLQAVFSTRSRDEWCRLFDGSDACVTPVLSPDEVTSHPHNESRATFGMRDGVPVPAPAPRFSRTPAGGADQDPAAIYEAFGVT
jgi:alpha-methylacyl-CoA racemase